MMYSHKNNQSGFSLVETLVAITILLIVIVGPLTLVTNSARSTDFANDQVMAFFLAQEGLELVQAVRDDLLIPAFDPSYSGSNAWDTFTETGGSGVLQECLNGGCGLHQGTYPAGVIDTVDCRSDLENCRLYFTDVPGDRKGYTHNTGSADPTRYIRVVTMDETDPGQVEVVSTVTWRSDGQRATQQVQTVTYLFDVYGR